MTSPQLDTNAMRMGSYELIELLARGGMSEVYLGRHRRHGHRVAVKISRSEAKNHEVIEAQRSRFFNEARAMVSIRHPNVVSLESYGETEDGGVYLVTEYVEGVTLRQQLEERKPLTASQIAHIAAQIADALTVAHDRGIIHRDLKPSNVMLVQGSASEQLVAKVLDFGIAKHIEPEDDEDAPITRTGVVLGTPKYMSPEQCRSEPTIDHRTDIYSLGVILYRMVAGRCPFEGNGPGDIIGKHLHVPAASPRIYAPEISDGLDALIMRCLAKQPQERFDTMHELAGALRELTDDALDFPVPTRRMRKARADTLDPLGETNNDQDATTAAYLAAELERANALPPRRKRRRGPLFVGLALTFSVVLGAALAFVNGWMSKASSQSERASAASPAPPESPAGQPASAAADETEAADGPEAADRPEAADGPEATAEPEVAAEPKAADEPAAAPAAPAELEVAGEPVAEPEVAGEAIAEAAGEALAEGEGPAEGEALDEAADEALAEPAIEPEEEPVKSAGNKERAERKSRTASKSRRPRSGDRPPRRKKSAARKSSAARKNPAEKASARESRDFEKLVY